MCLTVNCRRPSCNEPSRRDRVRIRPTIDSDILRPSSWRRTVSFALPHRGYSSRFLRTAWTCSRSQVGRRTLIGRRDRASNVARLWPLYRFNHRYRVDREIWKCRQVKLTFSPCPRCQSIHDSRIVASRVSDAECFGLRRPLLRFLIRTSHRPTCLRIMAGNPFLVWSRNQDYERGFLFPAQHLYGISELSRMYLN